MPANPREQWVWENVEVEYVNEINESNCFPFVEIEGLRIRMQDNANMLDYLELYLTDQILEHTVHETNRLANDFITQYPGKTKNTYIGRWTDVATPELKKLIGSVILMGIIHKPSLPDYWSLGDMYCTPIFSSPMIRDRFFSILKFLHFNNNNDPAYDANDKNRDRLHKLRPFLEMACDRCKRVYQPGKCLSVDESLVLFKGRLHFKQYIMTERARFGNKLYELTTSNRITLDLLVYCGKGIFYNDDEHSDMPTTERIPVVLMEPFLNKGHILFTDNYYTSPSLATHLLENLTHLCGTVRSNRKFYFKEIVNVQLEKGAVSFFRASHDERIIASKNWTIKDKSGNQQKIVYLLSTCYQAEMIQIGNDHLDNQILKPRMVKSYSTHMGGIGRVDKQLHAFQALRK